MVSVYRQGQAKVLWHHLGLAEEALKAYLVTAAETSKGDANSTGPKEALVDRVFLTLANSLVDEAFLCHIEELMGSVEGDGLDEDMLLFLAIIHEQSRGSASPWAAFFEAAFPKERERVEEFLGKEDFADIQDQFCSFVRPFLDSSPNGEAFPEELFNATSFAWAACVQETHGASLPRKFLDIDSHAEESDQVYGILMVE
ncbi:hypothetical protein HK104_000791 [Borealophlyctis nickersoniae]|nr:hypothetical protein HK104_000791 [Borealophlyctis nickersoniae]